MDNGYVMLQRSIMDSWIWRNDSYLRIWCYLLFTANYKPSECMIGGQLVTVERGQVVTSIRGIAKACGVSEKQVRTFISHGQKSGKIRAKKGTGATVLTIIDYDNLQERHQPEGHTKGTRRAHEGHYPKKEERRKEELNNNVVVAPSSSELAAGLLQNDGQMFPVTRDQAARWQELYPAVDVATELLKITGWLEANPSRRKTKRGMLSFVNRWLAKEQDKGGGPQQVKRTVGDRQAAIDYRTSFTQLEKERDAVTNYIVGRARAEQNKLDLPAVRGLTEGAEDRTRP